MLFPSDSWEEIEDFLSCNFLFAALEEGLELLKPDVSVLPDDPVDPVVEDPPGDDSRDPLEPVFLIEEPPLSTTPF